jgi:transposase, IS6 family
VINVDRNKAYPRAVEELKEEGILPPASQLRQSKYLNNILERRRRFIKRRVDPGLGFRSFNTARRTIGGYETVKRRGLEFRECAGQPKGRSDSDVVKWRAI